MTSMTTRFPYRRHPCAECPFRVDTEPGQFTDERYRVLRRTVGTDDDMRMPGDGLFACHKSREGREEVCAGWLVVCGDYHLTVRMAVVSGELPGSALSPGSGWPALHATYDEMSAAKGRCE